jgi:hypothetical protein
MPSLRPNAEPAVTAVAAGDIFVIDGATGVRALAASSVALTASSLAQFAATTSAQLASLLSDETGSGSAVFANAPTMVNPVVGTQSPGDNTTKAASTGFVTAAIAARGIPRTVLTAPLTYFVRAPLPKPTFTNGSANVTMTAHGLSANDPIVLSILPNETSCTISSANPAVVTMANTFAAGQPVTFRTSGYLGPGILAGTTYYVLATGLSGSSFQIATTPGGSAISNVKNTLTAASGTGAALQITASGTTNLVAGQEIAFSNSGGALPGGLSASTTYYVAASPAPTATVFYVSATNGGTNIAFSTAGTGTNSIEQIGGVSAVNYNAGTATHLCDQAGAMPTFSTAGILVAGTVYFVGTVVDANTVTLSTTLANANPIGTATLATGAPVYAAATGNDANNGLAQTRAGALLNIQTAVNNITANIDAAGQTLTVQVADGTYVTAAGVTLKNAVGVYDGHNATSGAVNLLGNTTNPSNVLLSATGTGQHAISAVGLYPPWWVAGFKLISSTGSDVSADGQSKLYLGQNEYGPAGSGNLINISYKSFIEMFPPFTISGGSAQLVNNVASSTLLVVGQSGPQAVTILGVPAFSFSPIVVSNLSYAEFGNTTFVGSATSGSGRFVVNVNSVIQTGGLV